MRVQILMPPDVTALLHKWRDGDTSAAVELAPLVCTELRRLAHRYFSHERHDHTLHSSELVHDAYPPLVDYKQACWQGPCTSPFA